MGSTQLLRPDIVASALDFGHEIRRLRRAAGMTQRELAAAAGVGERFIVELESGKPRCELDRALRVLRMLGAGVTIVPRSITPP
ncbi:MAG: helix-turn-helix transcriptional regulator [Rhodospirillaceae bacterium]|nr:helix-turn-helix transcriptional regulator [Rhodospirillaceae bacterium]